MNANNNFIHITTFIQTQYEAVFFFILDFLIN